MSYRRFLLLSPLLALALAVVLLAAQDRLRPGLRSAAVVSAPARGPHRPEAGSDDVAAGAAVADADLAIFREKLGWARARRLDTLPLGEIIARLGESFVGTTFKPYTLEAPGPERLVVNLRELDCVTFVENVLVLARLVRAGQDDFDGYRAELTRVRYRDGRLDGYPSRLHYFSDWVADNERKGLVRDLTRELGGVADPEPIHFMSTHPDAYRQLAEPGVFEAIRATEAVLSRRTRYTIPEAKIADVAPEIGNGDVIAATTNIPGLDVAHTGIALWKNGALHLLHAPLVGKSVEISERPLAERIRRIASQDGIMIARPR
ncbi:MAG: DUF1460 domain-containing protein [Gemmatimonadetes bacterium]|nr:DUF1460 domain-containing protein [Gemmatimonadota bacterium]